MSTENNDLMIKHLIDKVAEQANRIGQLERENEELRGQLQRSNLVKDKKL